MPSLFDPIELGAIAAPNRILMAPLTRTRSMRDHVPTSLMGEYYAQRAGAGLIISEAIGVSREGLGTCFAPGLWSAEQTEGWKPVVEAVHRAGGRIIAQLWHMGRLVHPDFTGAQPVSASATAAPGNVRTYQGKQAHVPARALERDEIPRLIDDYALAARNALAAGFDGLQLHSANGYLLDQFLRDGSNLRDDDYGGPVENRIRLTVEITRILANLAGAGRVSVRLSPNGDAQGVNDSAPETVFPAVAGALSALGIGFLEVREPRPGNTFGAAADRPAIAPLIRARFDGPLVLNSDYRGDSAQAALDAGEADAISFGRTFIANPDLPARLRLGAPLAQDNMATWYTPGPAGYTDYSVHAHD